MALKTRENPMGALGTKTYILTVVTNPSSATCTLTYDGVQYVTKSLEVKAGSTVSYSVYQSTYGTTTGTITMDSDKTLNCTGTYSTSYTYSLDIIEVGNLTKSGLHGGVISGFSAGKSSTANRAYSTYYCNYSNMSSFEVQVGFTTPGSFSRPASGCKTILGGATQQYDPIWLHVYDYKLHTSMLSSNYNTNNFPSNVVTLGSLGDSSNHIKYNTYYTVKYVYANGTWKFYVNNTQVTVSTERRPAISKLYNDYLGLGVEYYQSSTIQYPWGGSINLNDTYIKVNGSEVWRGVKAVPNYTYYWNKSLS